MVAVTLFLWASKTLILGKIPVEFIQVPGVIEVMPFSVDFLRPLGATRAMHVPEEEVWCHWREARRGPPRPVGVVVLPLHCHACGTTDEEKPIGTSITSASTSGLIDNTYQ